LGTLLVLLEPLEVGFKEGDLKFFETYGVRDIEFWVFLLLEIQLNYKKGFGM